MLHNIITLFVCFSAIADDTSCGKSSVDSAKKRKTKTRISSMSFNRWNLVCITVGFVGVWLPTAEPRKRDAKPQATEPQQNRQLRRLGGI